MKSMKKLVLVGLVLLASVMVLAGCKNDSVPETPKYTVTFDKNAEDATGEMDSQTFTQGEKKELPANAFVRPTWTFSGWSTNKEATTHEYGDKAQFSVTKDTTLYAIWTENAVDPVTFSRRDGTKFFYNESFIVFLATTTEGATIKYKLDDGDWQDYDGKIILTSNTTITAKATKEGLKDSEETRATYTIRELTSITITPLRTLYSVGERVDSTAMVVTVKYDDGESLTFKGGTIDNATSSLTETAGVKEVIVSYSEGEKTVTATFTVNVVDPSIPTRLENYISPNDTDDRWTYVAFGEWPQSKAQDFTPKTEAKSYGFFENNYYEEADGKYVQQGGQYYTVEPIIWRVLNNYYADTGKALLLAEKILIGGIPYYVDHNTRTITGGGTKEGEQNTVYPNNYKYSTIRAWLNGSYEADDTQEKNYDGKGFLQTAFTDGALEFIVDTTVDNTAWSTNTGMDAKMWDSGNNSYACENTIDKIFLLSEQEATYPLYGFDIYAEWAWGRSNTLIRVNTDYAKDTWEPGWWGLRSPSHEFTYYARNIRSNGYAISYIDVESTTGGVVPALCVSASDIK